MAYSEFTIKKVKADFDLEIVENVSLFGTTQPLQMSDYLSQTLKRNVPVALAINTEKARSELIIINILMEVKEKLLGKVSLFSGIDFNVDKDKGLMGFCDYIMSGSAEQLYLDIPIVTIVEAKNENINSGLGQCIAEMVAAAIYNEREGVELPCMYGAVTTGDEWKFIKLVGQVVYIDMDFYYMSEIQKIVAILVQMIKESTPCAHN